MLNKINIKSRVVPQLIFRWVLRKRDSRSGQPVILPYQFMLPDFIAGHIGRVLTFHDSFQGFVIDGRAGYHQLSARLSIKASSWFSSGRDRTDDYPR